MKSIVKSGFAAFLLLGMLVSCKDREVTAPEDNIETVAPAEEESTMASDTSFRDSAQAHSDAAGTTSGKMEQVP